MTSTAALVTAVRDARLQWQPRASLAAGAFGMAALAPLVAGDARTVDLANGLYLAVAGIGLAVTVGLAGLPLVAQGAFLAVGAVVSARLLQHGVATPLAALAGCIAAAATGLIVGTAFARLPRAAFAAATWIVAWLVALSLRSLTWPLGGSQGLPVEGGPTPTQHYELALLLTALAGLAYGALARAPFGLRLAAARERETAARALRVPVERLRAGAVAVSAAAAGLAGALSVQLAAVADPASYDPYLSFKLFVVVLIGGALAPLGAPAGVIVLGVLSVAAGAIGSLEHVSAARAHTLLAAVLLLGVVSLGWDGLVRPARRTYPSGGGPPLHRATAHTVVATGLRKHFGAIAAADGVDLEVAPGSITALVGPNGSGKTTVLRLLAGTLTPDAGTIERGHDAVTRTLQATAVFPSLTPLEHLLVASSGRRLHGGFVRSLLSTPKARAEEAVAAAEARRVLERFGLPESTPAGTLPVTDQRALMLAAAYETGASVLLVDEPAAGASAAERDRIAELLCELRNEGLGLLVVEHNLGLVRRLADRIVVLDAGRVIASGSPAEIAADSAVREAYLGRRDL